MSKAITYGAVGVALWGLITFIGGYALLFPMRPVRGIWARVIGVIGMLPLPVAYGLGYLWASVVGRNGWVFTLEELRQQGMNVEAALVLSSLTTMYVIAARSNSTPAGGTTAGQVNQASRDSGSKNGIELNDEQYGTTKT
jgi:hypothetical protein